MPLSSPPPSSGAVRSPLAVTITITITITYMELPARPEREFPALPAGARLEEVTRPSVRFYRYLYDAVGRDWLWWERRAKTDADLAAVIHHPAVEVRTLMLGGEPVGFCELDFRTPETPDLALFGLVPEMTGRGLGPAFMGAVQDVVWSRQGVRTLTLNTCTLDHPKAPSFYRSVGFRAVRTEDKVIADPRLRPGWQDGPGLLKDVSPPA